MELKNENENNMIMYENFINDFSNKKEFLTKLIDIYDIIYSENFENILILSKDEFIELIKESIKNILINQYSSKLYENNKFITLIQTIYDKLELEYNEFINELIYSNSDFIKEGKKGNKLKIKINKDTYNNFISHFLKHCPHTEKKAIHCCSSKNKKIDTQGIFVPIYIKSNDIGKNFRKKFFFKNNKSFKDADIINIKYVLCSNCHKIYFRDMFFCFCNFCNINYYSKVLPKEENCDLQPATWGGHNCNVHHNLFNEEIFCSKCGKIIYIDIKNNILKCLNPKCNFSIDPKKVNWKCKYCSKEFNCGIKVYNPVEKIIISKVIKKTLLLHNKAYPQYEDDDGDDKNNKKQKNNYEEYFHSNNCNGILYLGLYNNNKIIVCEKCKEIFLYENFKWDCHFSHISPKKILDINKDNINTNDNNLKSYKDLKLTIINNNIINSNLLIKKNNIRSKYKLLNKLSKSLNNKEIKKNNETNNTNYPLNQIKVKKNLILYPNIFNKKSNFKIKFLNVAGMTDESKKETEKNNIIKIPKNTKIKENKTKNIKLELEYNKKFSKSRFLFYKKIKSLNSLSNNSNSNNRNDDGEGNDGNKDNEKEKKEVNFSKNTIKVKPKFIQLEKSSEKISKESTSVNINNNSNINSYKYNRYKRFRLGDNNKSSNSTGNIIKRYNNNKNIKNNNDGEGEKFDENKKEEEIKIKKIEVKRKNKDKDEDNVENKKPKFGNMKLIKLDTNKINSENSENKFYNKKSIFKRRFKIKVNYSNLDVISGSKNLSLKNEKKQTNRSFDLDIKRDNKEFEIIDKDIINNPILYNRIENKIKKVIEKSNIPSFNIKEYKILKSIGEGTFGVIYEVMNKLTSEKNAMKQILAQGTEKLEKFLLEFEIVYHNPHTNILNINGIYIKCLEKEKYLLYVLMDLAENDWEKEIISKEEINNYYTEKELIIILKQLCSVLAFLQKNKKIAHRDIKPENILIFNQNKDSKKKYKLCDFSEAQICEDMNELYDLKGTEIFMSPILYNALKNGIKKVKHNVYKSDMFSFGYCFLYASSLNFDIINSIRDLNFQGLVDKILIKHLKKRYSDEFIEIISKMIKIEENERIDFIDLEKILKGKYNNINI